MEEVEDEPLFCNRVAGIDIGKAEVMVTIRVPSETRKGAAAGDPEVRDHQERTAGAGGLAAGLAGGAGRDGVHQRLLEAGALPAGAGGFRLPAVSGVAGQGAARAAEDGQAGLGVAGEDHRAGITGRVLFVPPEEIRRLRTHTRYRRKLVQMRTAQKERCEKLLEDAHLKLSSVISDIHGVSGRDMLRAIIAGERSPAALAEMARGVMRRKTARLEEALDCSFFTEEHAFILEMMLDSIDQLTAQIEILDDKIAEMCKPYERQVEQLDGIPGFGITTARDLIAEIGTDMSVFPTTGHLASWARQAPRVIESAGKRKGKNATGRGNPYIGGTLGEASVSVGRTQTFLGAKYRRLCTHMPRKKAQGAIMRTQLVIAHALLSDPEARYEDLGPDYYERKADTRRRARSHVRGLERLGYKVSIEAIDPGTGELLPVATDR